MSGKYDCDSAQFWPRIGNRRASSNTTSRLQSAVSRFRRSALRESFSWLDSIVCTTGIEDENTGSLPSGGQRASRTWSSDGNPFGDAGGAADHQGPRFDLNVPEQGYGWWYADAISDDGDYGFSIIAMIGSVFSPYYAWSGRKNPQNYSALNVGIYGKAGKRWTMTERGENDLVQEKHTLKIGPSNLRWDDGCLVVEIDEWANPIPRKVKGTIRITPRALTTQAFQLDESGKHFWQPLGAKADVEVEFSSPKMSWTGTAYLDCNWGSEPLEEGFKYWDWSRAHLNDGTALLYDADTRSDGKKCLVLHVGEDGKVTTKDPLPKAHLSKGPIWRVARSTLCDYNFEPKTLSMLEDTPFYTRSRIATSFYGEEVIAIHESLDCDRFASQWVRCLLPFKMPRIKS